jgi:hypothetical protein
VPIKLSAEYVSLPGPQSREGALGHCCVLFRCGEFVIQPEQLFQEFGIWVRFGPAIGGEDASSGQCIMKERPD